MACRYQMAGIWKGQFKKISRDCATCTLQLCHVLLKTTVRLSPPKKKPSKKNTPPFWGGHMFFLAPFPELRSILWQCFRSTRSRRWAAFVRRNMARQAPKASKSCCFWLKLEAILERSHSAVRGVHHQLPTQRKNKWCWLEKRGKVGKNPWELYRKNIGNIK